MKPLSKAVFLDRDGVLNQSVIRNGKPYPPASLADVKIIDGVANALNKLHAAGFLLLVVTNQPDVARGTTKIKTVEEINNYLQQHLILDDIFVCYHDDNDQCNCRKPLPGLFLQAATKYGINLAESFMVGDRWRDIDAGKNANCKTIWIDVGYDERAPSSAPDFIAKSLAEAADWILKNSQAE